MFNYEKLQIMLLKRRMKKKELMKLANISNGTMARFYSNKYVSMEVVDKICQVLKCQPGDIMEHVDDPTLIPDQNNEIETCESEDMNEQ